MKLERPNDRQVTAALLTVQTLFAVHYIAAKWLLEQIPAPAWVALRVASAAIVLMVLAGGSMRRVPWSWRLVGQLAVLAVFGVIINQILFIEGLSRTVPSHSALINTSIPVTTLLLAVIFRHERMTLPKALAVLFAFSGVTLLLSENRFDLSRTSMQGDLMCLANATSFSLFLVLSRPVLRKLPARAATATLFALGAIGVVAYGAPSLRALDWASVPVNVWWTGVFIVAGPTVGSYFLNSWALQRTESSRVALFIYLQFVLAAPLSWLLLDEQLSWRLIPAAVLVLAGLLLASRQPSPSTA